MCFGLFGGWGWFVGSYLALYIISPILNSFVKQASNRILISVTFAFVIFQTLWGLTLSVGYIMMGYSVFSFIGLYLLAQLVKRYRFILNMRLCIIAFISCTTINFVIYCLSSKFGLFFVRDIIVAYINPLVIIQAVALFGFSYLLPFHDKCLYINKLAKSCFAIYLFHIGTPFAIDSFKNCMLFINNNYHGIKYLVVVSSAIVSIYALAILFDQPRKWLWNHVYRIIDQIMKK